MTARVLNPTARMIRFLLAQIADKQHTITPYREHPRETVRRGSSFLYLVEQVGLIWNPLVLEIRTFSRLSENVRLPAQLSRRLVGTSVSDARYRRVSK